MKPGLVTLLWLSLLPVATAGEYAAGLPAAALPADLTLQGIGRSALALVAVLIGFGVFAWVLRRNPKLRGEGGPINAVGQLPLSGRERLLLIEVDGVRLLLNVTPGVVRTLHVFERPVRGTGGDD